MNIAVLGAGISGLGSAYLLSKKHTVDLYEKEHRLGGHARTTFVEENGKKLGVDTGFLVFNHPTYPLLTKLFKQLNIKIENTDMSFAFWHKDENIVYNGSSLPGMFCQKKNLFRPSHYIMINDILNFNKKANKDLEENHRDLDKTLGEYIKNYSKYFKSRYILPMGGAIWSTSVDEMNKFPARTFIQFFKNHGLLGIDTHHQWLTVSGGSINYVEKISKEISGEIFLNSSIKKIKRSNNKVILIDNNNNEKIYDKVVLAMHAPDALNMLDDASEDEKEILGAFNYKPNHAVLHNDNSVLYKNRNSYAAWNYTMTNENKDSATLTYWNNVLQNLKTDKDYFVSLNETKEIKNVIENIEYEHPQFNTEAINAQSKRDIINGKNNTYYAGAYWRYGFHEDGLYSANTIAKEFGCEL